MKIATEVDTLKSMLATVIPAVESKGFQWMEGIFIVAEGDKITVKATNDLFSIQDEGKAKVYEDGIALVNAKTFASIVNKSKPGMIQLESNNNTLRISTATGIYKTAMMDESEFKASFEIDNRQKNVSFEIESEKLTSLINRVRSTINTDENRPSICGIHFVADGTGELKAETTDGLRVSIATLEGIETEEKLNLTVPYRSVSSVCKVLSEKGNAEITTDGKRLLIKNGCRMLCTALVSGMFVETGKLFREDSKTKVIVGSKPLKEAIDRVMTTSEKELVTIDVKESCILVQAAGATSAGDEEIDCEQIGNDIVINLNAKLLNALLSSAGDEIIIGLDSPASPAMIVPKNDDERYVFMIAPLRPINTVGA